MSITALGIICLLYNLALITGTAYLVQVHQWTPWWFVLTVMCLSEVNNK